jgi:hypothetical protein
MRTIYYLDLDTWKFKMKKKYVVFVIVILLFSVSFVFIGNNKKFLFTIASGSNEPSFLRYWALEKIYKHHCKKDDINIIISEIDGFDDKILLLDCYTRVLGVAGDKDAFASLMMIYAKYQDNNKYKSTIFNAINSMSLLGDKRSLRLLNKLIKNYDEHDPLVPKTLLLSSVYLLLDDFEAERYKIFLEETHSLLISDKEEEARRLIHDSNNRKRTFEEMMFFEYLFRPRGWDHQMGFKDLFR